MKRLGLIGDIHAEDTFLADALSFLEQAEVDRIAATGDVADGRGSVDRCVDLLRERDAIVVAGNHERWLIANQMRDLPDATPRTTVSDESIDYLRDLPTVVEIATASGTALLCHGLGTNDMAMVRPDDFGYAIQVNSELQALIRDESIRYVLNGHSHRRMARRFGDTTIINAGTLKHDHEPGFLIVDFAAKTAETYHVGANGPELVRTDPI